MKLNLRKRLKRALANFLRDEFTELNIDYDGFLKPLTHHTHEMIFDLMALRCTFDRFFIEQNGNDYERARVMFKNKFLEGIWEHVNIKNEIDDYTGREVLTYYLYIGKEKWRTCL